MRRIFVLALTLALGAAGGAQASSIWQQHPNLQDIKKVYPRAAARNRNTAVVEITCKVNAESRLEDCKVASEQPAGQGFGEAALKLAPKFKLRKTIDGQPVTVGTEVTAPIKFDPY
ncbi:MAG TPA: TonB family protein [Caulobacteraceae bacterium]|nr:TonB family protein [Caulobacteraceae bacterium]